MVFVKFEGWFAEWRRKKDDDVCTLLLDGLHRIGRGWIGGNVVIISVDSYFTSVRQQNNKTKLNKFDLTLVQCENGDRVEPIKNYP